MDGIKDGALTNMSRSLSMSAKNGSKATKDGIVQSKDDAGKKLAMCSGWKVTFGTSFPL